MIKYLTVLALLAPELYAMDASGKRELDAANMDRALPQAILELDAKKVQTLLNKRDRLSEAEYQHYIHLTSEAGGDFRCNESELSLWRGWSALAAKTFASICAGTWLLTRKFDGKSSWYATADNDFAKYRFKFSLYCTMPVIAVALVSYGLHRYCTYYNAKTYTIAKLLHKSHKPS